MTINTTASNSDFKLRVGKCAQFNCDISSQECVIF
jgi:hypothetical protein